MTKTCLSCVSAYLGTPGGRRIARWMCRRINAVIGPDTRANRCEWFEEVPFSDPAYLDDEPEPLESMPAHLL